MFGESRSISLDLVTRWLAIVMITSALLVVGLLQWLVAPYGRYSSRSWGFLINARLAWVAQELPSLLVPICVINYTTAAKWGNSVNKTLLCVFFIHYIQRALIYPVLIRGGKPSPFTVFILAFSLCSYNGFLQSLYLVCEADYPTDWLSTPTFLIGITMFACGLCINVHSDHILRSLRRPKETGYKIPRGGLFEYISGANFFGEMMEWTGWAIACWSLPALAFNIFTICNLAPRAVSHHRWYQEKFGSSYPRNRKAIIPFLL